MNDNMNENTNRNISDDSIELLCNRCGKTFSAFLHQMEEQNAKVVCPDCSDPDCRPSKTGSSAGNHPTSKPN